MAFTLPEFPLAVNIWHAPHAIILIPPAGPPDVVTVANYVVRAYPWLVGYDNAAAALLPKLTDVRDGTCSTNNGWPDVMEMPAGSGCYWQCVNVVDAGKGFANEHRVVQIVKYPPWPAPIP